jgi:hypothetical protein
LGLPVTHSHCQIVTTLDPLTAVIVTWSKHPDSLTAIGVAIWIGASRVGALVIDGDTVCCDWLIATKDRVGSVSECETSGTKRV